jgi:hypothetical protein
MLEWLETSSWAETISQSQMLLATLSSVHLLGLTLIMSAMLVSNMRVLGAMFRAVPAGDIHRPATRMLGLGLAISVVTGFLLVMPRAATAVANPTFRLKMALIAAGVLAYGIIVVRTPDDGNAGGVSRALSAAALVLWAGALLAGLAFILLE